MSGMKPHEITLGLDRALEHAKEFITAEGYYFPSLYVFSRDRKLDIKSDHPSVVSFVSNEDIRRPGGKGFYQTVLAFRMRSKEDDAALQAEADRIAEEYKPDGMALVISCVFRTHQQHRETPEDKRMKVENGTRCIHMCAFVPGEEGDMVRVIPYKNKGKVKNISEVKIRDEVPEFIYDTFFVDMPWLEDGLDLSPKISNPYKTAGN